MPLICKNDVFNFSVKICKSGETAYGKKAIYGNRYTCSERRHRLRWAGAVSA
jgi:hypothetical protein